MYITFLGYILKVRIVIVSLGVVLRKMFYVWCYVSSAKVEVNGAEILLFSCGKHRNKFTFTQAKE